MTDQTQSANQQRGYQEARRRIQAKCAGGRELELQNLDLTAVPPEIGQLTSLKKLWLDRNQLTTLPPEIGRLGDLRLLHLGKNQLSSLPPEIGQLQALENLNIERNRFATLPTGIGELKGLQSLAARDNQLTELPPWIGRLAKLTDLNLENNQLIALPPEIGALADLEFVNLQANRIEELPPEIGQLTKLCCLILDGNRLGALPPEIGKLTSLLQLYLENNDLAALPAEMAALESLEELFLHGNPRLKLPKGILGHSQMEILTRNKEPKPPKPILEYYFAAQNQPAVKKDKNARVYPLEPGDAWADAALAALAGLPATAQDAWRDILVHCARATSPAASKDWLERSSELLSGIGVAGFKGSALAWLRRVKEPRTADSLQSADAVAGGFIMPAGHQNILRGLAWMCALTEDRDCMRALTALALEMFKKVPGVGPRAAKVGNACVNALAMMPGVEAVGQIALLKLKLKSGAAQRTVAKTMAAVAARQGLTAEELEELAVPDYGMTEVGRRIEAFGDFRAELVIEGSKAGLIWRQKDGKPCKSPSAAVKREFAAGVKELVATRKDAESMLRTHAARIDAYFLQRKTWPLTNWRSRYLDHPLVGTLARRLIWNFTTNGRTTAGAWCHDGIHDRHGQPVPLDAERTIVALWHPLDQSPDDVLGWRAWLEQARITQPFKQAHREVYLLTDAERETGTYTNRFAGHLLRQHQMNALAEMRGWKPVWIGNFDSPGEPELWLPGWNLRVQFELGVDLGVDYTSDAGIYLYVTTCKALMQRDGRPFPLAEVPPLVFSEVMRDLDLFVSVCSVANDPAWADNRRREEERVAWRDMAFGDLSAIARTRLELLQTLVPRLKIWPRCSFAGKYLIVRGDLRTYKIHLGSGNILMEPNDQYLCIVPEFVKDGDRGLFLPFEGDHTLSLIISKAFLLAEDSKITDPSITTQILAEQDMPR